MAFGATTDHFGFADTNWRPQSTSKSPRSSNAQAEDSNGDIACETVYDTGYTYEVQYRITKGAAADTNHDTNALEWPATLKGGTVVDGIVITGATIETSNTERPLVTVSGEDIGGADSTAFSTYDWPSVVPSDTNSGALRAVKKAQAIGFSPDTNTRVNSSTLDLTTELAATADSQGERVAADVYQGRAEASADLVSCDTIADISSVDTGWTQNGPVEQSEENEGYGSSSVNVFQNLSAA